MRGGVKGRRRYFWYFFIQAEDGRRDGRVTGVQTCALPIFGGEEGIPRVRFTLTNTGSRTGTEVAQVYVGRLPTSLPTPVKQLAGVARVALQPGESRTVTVSLDRLSLSYWDSQADRWVTPTGRVAVLVGSSSRNIQLSGSLTIRPGDD